ncbi:hypothetical protein QCM80_37700 [Bradyrhizobium sp. SSUT112]|nr:hypothetical protein [Bradyrhizobium sp. SSUT112]MDH2356351.1 hypothetical protein [Bradyrhizobium sp. SSUT112]
MTAAAIPGNLDGKKTAHLGERFAPVARANLDLLGEIFRQLPVPGARE